MQKSLPLQCRQGQELPEANLTLQFVIEPRLYKGDLVISQTDGCLFRCLVPVSVLHGSPTSFYYRVALPTIRHVAATQVYSFLHAGLASLAEGTLLYIGPSGSGKTTLSLALLGLGAKLHSDDQVFSWIGNGTRKWDGVRRPLNVRPQVAAEFLPGISSELQPYLPTSEKLAFMPWSNGSDIPDVARAIDLVIRLVDPTEILVDTLANEMGALLGHAPTQRLALPQLGSKVNLRGYREAVERQARRLVAAISATQHSGKN